MFKSASTVSDARPTGETGLDFHNHKGQTDLVQPPEVLIGLQRDVMQTMATCAENYDVGTMAQYSMPLWSALKFEILSAQEPELADEALLTLKAVAVCLSRTAHASSMTSPLILYLKPVVKECLEHFQQPAQRQAKASGDILHSIGSGNDLCFDFIIGKVAIPLLDIYKNAGGILQQRSVLELFNKMLEASVSVYGTWSTPGLEIAGQGIDRLSQMRDQILAVYTQALMGTSAQEVSFRLVAAQGLLLISKLRSFLQENEIGLFVQHFNDIVLNEDSFGRDELKQTAIAGLAEISLYKSRLLTDVTLPAFLARLPETETSDVNYRPILEALAQISARKELRDVLIRRLANRLDLLLRVSGPSPFPFTCTIISTIHSVLESASKGENIKSSLDAYYARFVLSLHATREVPTPGDSLAPLADEQVLTLLGKLANLVVRNVSMDRLPEVAANVYTLFQLSAAEDPSHIPSQVVIGPHLLVSTWLLSALPRTLRSPLFDPTSIYATIDRLVEVLRTADDFSIRLTCLRQVALYINKHVPSASLETAKSFFDKLYHKLPTSSDSPTATTDWEVRLLFAISKALILRLAPSTNDILSDLVSVLNIENYGSQISGLAASAFGSLLPPDDVLCQENHCQIRLLTPQRVFQVVTPLIAANFKASSSPEEKQNYLTALSGIVGTVPSDIVMPELPTLLPLLLQSLDLPDQTVKTATLETLAVVITSNPSTLEESGHLPALIKRLLASTTSRSAQNKVVVDNAPRTKRLAARCLGVLPQHISGSASRVNPLLSLKKEVVHGLIPSLDDPRRDVRREAVNARNVWLRTLDDRADDEDDA